MMKSQTKEQPDNRVGKKQPISEIREDKKMTNVRVNEIMNKITAFEKEMYNRDDKLNELLKLQSEMAKITFGDEQAEGKRFYDISDYYSEKNRTENKGADELVENFRNDCHELVNAVRGEISGRIGEDKTFKRLSYLTSAHSIRKNIEIGDGSKKTEIDALVVTEKAAFIVEVKNTKRDIFIDEAGQYYRTGEFLKWDSDLGAKLAMRETFVRTAAEQAGIRDIKIVKIVVFTDFRISVHNKCREFRTCFLNQLASIIDNYAGEKTMSLTEINNLMGSVDTMTSVSTYATGIDVQKIKKDFAELVSVMDYPVEAEKKTKQVWWREIFSSISFKNAAAILLTIGIATAIATIL